MEVIELQAGTYLPKNSMFLSDKTQVETVAVIEAGVHLLMLAILTIEIVAVYAHDHRKDVEFILMWTYFYFNHGGCVLSSVFLYVSVSKMNIGRIQSYIKFAAIFYVIWLVATLGELVAIEAPHSLVLAIIIALALYKLLSLIIVHAFLKRWSWKKFSTSHYQLSVADIQTFENGNEYQQSDFPGESFDSLPYNKAYEIPFENLSLDSILLGKGRFGRVLKGNLKTDSSEGYLTVAVKTIESHADGCYIRSLLAELKILSRVGQHEHIVNLIGACTGELKQRKLYIVVEFCAHGSIENYIQARKGFFENMIVDDQILIVTNTVRNTNYIQLYENVTTLDMLNWAYQTSRGMEYLANKNIIHGDLAARNILLTENLSIKIADFGLSRYLYDKLNYIKKQEDPLPWRWMAVESLCSREFSTKTDVWSYAITLWEMFTLCETPFQDFNWSEEFVNMIKKGYRLQRPVLCTSGIYELMCSCWELDPKCRPDFRDVCEYFAKVINAVKAQS
ncbi:receptor-like tyrosine-protein kinase kin-16 [Bradysia coprophila]|uniref:receptor-like tyrosine-protein kinase kin-16 n=1 Tax=Bradysia coprophila TaxID=38358 RepID=UPI00187DD42B|nr:receptor-like tyrosine-protein kinase kin-16 [Bradysia coprophila]